MSVQRDDDDDVALGRMSEIDCSALGMDEYHRFLMAKTEPEMVVIGRKVRFRKSRISADVSLAVQQNEPHLFDYQKFIVALAAERRRFAIFADAGLGKTAMALAWIRLVAAAMPNKKILVIAPLAVVPQWMDEAKRFYGDGLKIRDLHADSLELWAKTNSLDDRIAITNHDKFHKKLDLGRLIGAVVLDESSIIKDGSSATRNSIVGTFKETPFRLALSATPAPNDRVEYGNHSTFLGYTRSNNEFLSMFFVNRDNGWEIKPHSIRHFYRFLANWSVYLRTPATFGFKDNITDSLPEVQFYEHFVPLTEQQLALTDFAPSKTKPMARQRYLSKLSKGFTDGDSKVATNKINTIAKLVGDKTTIVWTEYNEESAKVTRGLREAGFLVEEIAGSVDERERVAIVKRLASGETQVVVSKPRILGFGLNLQFVTNQIWSGLTHSYEQFYQAVKRSHRYGAKEKIEVHLPMTEFEHETLENIRRKKDTFEEDTVKQEAAFVANQAALVSDFIGGRAFATIGSTAEDDVAHEASSDGWRILRGDSIEMLRGVPPNSMDLAVFSPPFSSLFTYSDNIADMGNSGGSGDGDGEFNLHFDYFLAGLMAAMKEGRVVCCHVSQLATLKYRDGFVGVRDFRGATIKAFQRAGFTFFGEWAIAKSPQMQAIKEKVRTLSFAQLDTDRLGSKPGFSDFILIFKKPGVAPKLTSPDGPSRDEWIEWACGVWNGIQESYTLNTQFAKTEDDVKHVCPLNLEVIDRCIRMYSAPGETVLDPFSGIGSTGVVAMCRGRNYLGIELKPEYFLDSIKNLAAAKEAGLPPIEELRKAVLEKRKAKGDKSAKAKAKLAKGDKLESLLPAAKTSDAIAHYEQHADSLATLPHE